MRIFRLLGTKVRGKRRACGVTIDLLVVLRSLYVGMYGATSDFTTALLLPGVTTTVGRKRSKHTYALHSNATPTSGKTPTSYIPLLLRSQSAGKNLSNDVPTQARIIHSLK